MVLHMKYLIKRLNSLVILFARVEFCKVQNDSNKLKINKLKWLAEVQSVPNFTLCGTNKAEQMESPPHGHLLSIHIHTKNQQHTVMFSQ